MYVYGNGGSNVLVERVDLLFERRNKKIAVDDRKSGLKVLHLGWWQINEVALRR